MRTYRNLYPQITSFANLHAAWRKARRGKRDRREVAAFEFDLEANLLDLQAELQDGAYQPGPYRNFYIRERKLRLISAAPFRDRVVHHALCRVVEPIWERRLIHDTYACRSGKGTHAALDRCQSFMRHYAYVLQCDVHQFFPAVDHAILYDKLARLIACPPTLTLIERVLSSGADVLAPVYETEWFPGDDLLSPLRARGLPIGNLTSQTWANIYLDSLDQFVKRNLKCRAYVRYCDDFLLFHDDKSVLHEWKQQVQDHLGGLRLALNWRRSVVYPTRVGVPFLGFVLFSSHRRLRSDNVRQARRRLGSQHKAVLARRLSHDRFRQSLRAWVAHAAHADTWRLRRSLVSSLRF